LATAVSILSLPVYAARAETVDLVADLPRKAEQLEREGRWVEAGETYLQLIRQQPEALEWQKRYRQCQHQDRLVRRYLNASFQQKVLKLSPQKALELYEDVLTLIGAHYVEEVRLDRLVAHGIESLDLALQNKTFLRATWPAGVKPEVVASYRQRLRRHWGDVILVSRGDAVQIVRAIADGMKYDTGALSTPIVAEFICAACETLDEYSAYLHPDRFAIEQALLAADVAGIGVELDRAGGYVIIAAVATDGPAARAGVRPNDQLLRIGDTPTHHLGVEEATLSCSA
jgi:carboxyl-terminal processing protease